MSLPSLFVCAALAFAGPQATPAAGQIAPRIELLAAQKWSDLLARDRRSTFGLKTATSAASVIDDRAASEGARCVAVVALGAGRCRVERARILALAGERSPELRQAAIFALGALGQRDDVGTLVEYSGRKVAQVADAAVFALALNATPEARAELARLEREAGDTRSEAIEAALAFLGEPQGESELARTWLGLRFEAARRHGLVDGQAWESLLVEDLARNQKFLNRVVYRCAANLKRPGIKDHYLEIALAGAPPERLRGVVAAIPEELCKLVDNGLFLPADESEWAIVVDEIERRRLEKRTESLLRRAWSVPSLRVRAAALLVRAKVPQSLPLLEVHLRSNVAAERALAAEAIGSANDASYVPDLSALDADPDEGVRAAALIARVRLGDGAALAAARDRLGLEGEKRTQLHEGAVTLFEAFLRVASASELRGLGIAALERLPGLFRSRLAIELVLGGYDPAREEVRQFLRRERPSGELGAHAVEALALNPGAVDVALWRELFPLGDELEVDAQLACGLVTARDAEAQPLLRAALWSEPWNRSALAAALCIEVAGIESLRLEVLKPPTGAGARDLRRVGFSLGEWGGVNEVEWLSARISPAEPALQGAVLGALGQRTH
jgi:HEAT repeat protein